MRFTNETVAGVIIGESMESFDNKKIYKEITTDNLKDEIDVWDVAEPLFLNGIIMKMKNDRL